MQKSHYLQIRRQTKLELKENFIWIHLLQDLVLLGVLLALWTIEPLRPFRIISFLLVTTLIFRSFATMHEAVHGCLSRNSKLNSFFGVLYGAVGLLPFEQWKQGHLSHHFWSGNIESDPVMAFLTVYPKMSRVLKSALNVCWKLWIPAIAFIQHTVFWSVSLNEFSKSEKNFFKRMSLIAPMVLWASVFAFSSPAFILIALVPGLLFYLLAAEVVNLPHHMQLTTLSGRDRHHMWDQHLTARSCEYPQWLASFVMLHFNLHVEHHMFPDAPCYYLSDLCHLTVDHLKQEYVVDHAFQWILENRKKNLDEVLYPEKQMGEQVVPLEAV